MTEFSSPLSGDFDEEGSWLRRKLGLLAGLVILAGAVAGGYWYFFLRGEAQVAQVTEQQTSPATLGTLTTTLSTTGTAASTLTSKLTFSTSAKVTSITAKLGEKVEAGQVLATLDSTDLQRKLESAQISLSSAQLKLGDLLEPATVSELATAQASIATAMVQLANAEENLRKAQPGADADAIVSADAAVATAEQSLTSAKNQVQSAWISLISAQRGYCSTDNRLVEACYQTDLPLTQFKIDSLVAEIRTPATTAVGSAASSLISANNSYNNSLVSVTNAEKSLVTATDKRAALDQPKSALEQQQLQSSVTSANASVLAAQQKYEDLVKGADAITVAQQQDAVRSAQLAYDTAKSAVDAVVLKAPFSGTITAVGIAVGDNVSASTAAFTITNTDAMRIDISVQEADFVGLAAGQYGTATFDALSGYTYVVRITAVNPTPTTTQGVVSYQVQAEILSSAQLSDPTTQQGASQALARLTGITRGARTGTGGAPGAASGTPGAAGPNANRTPGAGGAGPQRTPGVTGSGPTGQQGAGQGGASGILQALLTAPLPTPGMNASVTILKSISENVLLIPSTAIRSVGTAKSVTVKKEDGTTEARVIQTGATDGTNTIVTSGLTEGEVVVVGTTTAATSTTAVQTNPQQGGFQGGPPGATGGGGTGATGGVR
ncbi:MAG: HlyD family efflux transporter periplasmic adaptor subunit [Dehalococcoidia bacterium]|nr:HlyD family efflux transporter periplasmic adaptor subunit [Dehalococcoidia bacterium]